MKKNEMLGGIMAKIIGLSFEVLGALYDLVMKLSGEAGKEWLAELKKFLRKESCWTGIVKETFLQFISSGESLILDAVDGSETLLDAKDLFVYIDSDFKNWNADEKGQATGETPVEVYEMAKDATFSQMFGELSADVRKNCLTQHQIKNFVKKYRSWLRTDGYAAFFLFESKGNVFVADVDFISDGKLKVNVRKFEDDSVWSAGLRRRIVVPQLA